MLPGTFAYICAGKRIAGIDAVKSTMSGRVLLALSMLGLLILIPLFYKNRVTRKKSLILRGSRIPESR